MSVDNKHSDKPTVRPDGKFTKTLLPSDFEPTPCSVICGRGKKVSLSPGNLHLSCLISSHLSQYSKAVTKQEKSSILQNIVTHVKQMSPSGGFVKFEEGSWWEVDDHAAREKVSGLFRDKLHSQYESSSKSKVAKRRARKTAAASANQVATTHDEEQYDHARNLLDLAMNGNASSKKQSTPPSNDVGSLPSRDIGTVLRHGIHPIGGFMTPNISNLTQLMIAGLRNQAVIHHPHLSLGNWPLTSLNHQVHTIAAAAAALNQSSHSSLLLSSIELKEQRRREIGSLLDRFDLYQYREKFLECGYDNIGWLLEHAMDDSVMKMVSKSVCFKPGHAIRFRHGLAKEAEALGLLTGSSKLPAEDSDDSEDEDGGSDNEKASSTATTVSNSPSPTAADAPAIPKSSRPTLDKASTNTSPSQKARPLRIWSPL